MTLLLAGTGAAATIQTTAVLPRRYVSINSTNPVSDGTVVNCDTVAEAQAVFDDGGAGGAKRVLMRRSASELTGAAPLVMKDRGGAWTELGYQGAALTPNTRYSPAQFQALNMPIFSCHAGPGLPVLDASNGGVSRYYINGVGFRGSGYTGSVWPIVALGGSNSDPSTMRSYNSRMLMHQCVVWLANPTTDGGATGDGAICGIAAEAHIVEIGYCWVEGIIHSQPDTQAVRVSFGPGMIRIHHCFLEASGEVFATGGSNPAYPRLMYDLVNEYNHQFKRNAWMTNAGYVLKNHNEQKQGIGCHYRYCIFENGRQSNQPGDMGVLWSCNQDMNGAPPPQGRTDMLTSDIVMESCWGKKMPLISRMSTRHDTNVSRISRRFTMRGNIMTAQDYWAAVGGAKGTAFALYENRSGVEPNGPDYHHYIDIQHNTDLIPGSGQKWLDCTARKMHNVRVRDNLGGCDGGMSWIVYANEGGANQAGWDLINTDGDCEFARNAFVATSPYRVNAGTNAYADTTALMKFVDSSVLFDHLATLADLDGAKLAADSPAKGTGDSGSDPGADIDDLQSVMTVHGVETDPSLLPA